MARNIIDEFFVTFGLDPSDYQKGEREVRKSFKDTRESAKSTFDDIETRGARTGSVFRSLRNEVAGLILVFAGAKSIVDFAGNMLTSEANASRLGETIGMNTGRVIAWERALKSVGGTAGEADASLKSIQDAMYKFKLTGQVDPGFQAFGVTPGDLDPDSSTPEDVLMKLARNKNGFNSKELAQRLSWLGVSQNTIYLMEQYKGGLRGVIDHQEKMAHVSKADADEAKAFQKELTDLQTTIEGDVRPELTKLIGDFNTFAQNGDNIQTAAEAIAAGIGAIGLALIAANPEIVALTAALLLIEKMRTSKDPLIRIRHQTPQEEKQSHETWGQWFHRVMSTPLISIHREGEAPASGAASAGPTGPAAISRGSLMEAYLVGKGRSPEQARGMVGAFYAENTAFDPSKKNGIGALGISQVLGPRKKALLARYGPHPTWQQELDFALWELEGRDPGAASVNSQTTARGTGLAMIRDFLRPQGNHWENMKDYVGDVGRMNSYLAKTGGTVHIERITVNTQATDGHAVARDLTAALRQRGIVAQANTGLTP